jgi:GTP-binding protein
MFMIDRADIYIKAGDGGDGLASFRRERYIPLGGPDGGDGGVGGNVIVEVDVSLVDLSHLAQKKKYVAANGIGGGKKKMHGKDGENLTILVPQGTMVYEMKENGEVQYIADLRVAGEKVLIAEGGKGGLGNVHFTTSTNQAPRRANRGKDGQSCRLILEYKMVTDICLIGKTNSGKSKLLSRLTEARPRIAEYPFSTRHPLMGVINGERKDYVVAEIPALVDGSSIGKGLGNAFLRHVERTSLIVYLLDATSPDIVGDISMLDKELLSYDSKLSDKAKIIAVNKIDLLQDSNRIDEIGQKLHLFSLPTYFLSAETGKGVIQFTTNITGIAEKEAKQHTEKPDPGIKIFHPQPRG